MFEIPEDFVWPEPWKPIPLLTGWLGMVKSVEDELQREVCSGHQLYRVTCRVIAFNTQDVNEFLFITDNPSVPLAFVHLTYKAETDPVWPYTVCYAGLEEFTFAWEIQDTESY